MDITTNYLIQFTLACLVLLSCQVSIGYSAVRCFRISTEENANNRGTSYVKNGYEMWYVPVECPLSVKVIGPFKRSYDPDLAPQVSEDPDLTENSYDNKLLRQQDIILQDINTVDNLRQYQNEDPYRYHHVSKRDQEHIKSRSSEKGWRFLSALSSGHYMRHVRRKRGPWYPRSRLH